MSENSVLKLHCGNVGRFSYIPFGFNQRFAIFYLMGLTAISHFVYAFEQQEVVDFTALTLLFWEYSIRASNFDLKYIHFCHLFQ